MLDAEQKLTQFYRPRGSPHAPRCGGERGAPFATDALDRTVGVDILLLPGFDLLDLAIAEEVANNINRTSRRYRFEIAVRSVCDGPARASCGVEISAISRRAPAQNLLVLGGAVQTPNQYAPWQFRLRRAAYDSRRVLCVGGGIFALAATGLLDGQAVAAPWCSAAAWRALAPRVRFVPAGWTESRKFHSALGGRAFAQFLLHCVDRQLDAATAGEIARALSIGSDPLGARAADGQDRLLLHCHPGLHAAIRVMRGNLDHLIKASEICTAANVNQRTLQRLFRRHLRTTVGAYYRTCRLEHARELVRLTRLSVIDIALSSGFESPTHFSDSYRRHFGCAPRQDRYVGSNP